MKTIKSFSSFPNLCNEFLVHSTRLQKDRDLHSWKIICESVSKLYAMNSRDELFFTQWITVQCGNYRNLFSRFFGKNLVNPIGKLRHMNLYFYFFESFPFSYTNNFRKRDWVNAQPIVMIWCDECFLYFQYFCNQALRYLSKHACLQSVLNIQTSTSNFCSVFQDFYSRKI